MSRHAERKEYQKVYGQEWRNKNNSYMRNYAIKRKYNMTAEQVIEEADKRQGKCDICGEVPERYCVDHIEIAGKPVFRGMLCNTCNLGLGMFKDNPELLQRAIEYLGGKGHGKGFKSLAHI